MHGCGEEQGGRRPAETVSLSSRHGMLRRHARWRLPSPLFVTSASGRADCVLTWELRLLAMERECQAGNNEGQEKDWQDALSATSERDGFAHGGVEGLGSVGVSAVAELQGVTSGFDRYIDGPVQFHRPARLSVDHYAVVPRRTSAPIALCVSLSVAAIIDLPLGSERRFPWYSATDATSRQRPSTSAGQREPLGRVIPSPLKYPRGHRGLPLDGGSLGTARHPITVLCAAASR